MVYNVVIYRIVILGKRSDAVKHFSAQTATLVLLNYWARTKCYIIRSCWQRWARNCFLETTSCYLILASGWFIVFCLDINSCFSSIISVQSFVVFLFLVGFQWGSSNPESITPVRPLSHMPAVVKCPCDTSSWQEENAFHFLSNRHIPETPHSTNTHTHIYKTHLLAIQQQILSSAFREQKINIEQNMLFVALGWAVTPLLLFHCGDIAFCCCDMVFISCGVQRVSLALCQSKWVMCCVQLALSAGTLAKVLFKRKTLPKHENTIYSCCHICLIIFPPLKNTICKFIQELFYERD